MPEQQLGIGMNVSHKGMPAIVMARLGEVVHIKYEDGSTEFVPLMQCEAREEESYVKSENADPYMTPITNMNERHDPYANNFKGGAY